MPCGRAAVAPMADDLDYPIRRATHNDVCYEWEDYGCSFTCLGCGHHEIILTEAGAAKRCDCGRIYQLQVELIIVDIRKGV